MLTLLRLQPMQAPAAPSAAWWNLASLSGQQSSSLAPLSGQQSSSLAPLSGQQSSSLVSLSGQQGSSLASLPPWKAGAHPAERTRHGRARDQSLRVLWRQRGRLAKQRALCHAIQRAAGGHQGQHHRQRGAGGRRQVQLWAEGRGWEQAGLTHSDAGWPSTRRRASGTHQHQLLTPGPAGMPQPPSAAGASPLQRTSGTADTASVKPARPARMRRRGRTCACQRTSAAITTRLIGR